MRVLFVLIILNLALAAPRVEVLNPTIITLQITSRDLGPRVQTMTLNIQQNEKQLILEVQTEDQHWNEMSFYIYKPGSRNFVRRILPPSQPGVYKLEYTFSDYGNWEINLRHGTGLDRYYGWINLDVDADSKNYTRRSVFQGDLDVKAPRYIQSIGFGVFGLLLLLTFGLITAILRWLSFKSKYYESS